MLSKINLIVVIGLSLLLLDCSGDEKESKSVVKINSSSLTEEELNNALSDYKNKGKFREEYIQNWIETEVVYNEAVKEGILDEKNYNTIIEQSKKKLAVSFFLKKLLNNNKTNPTTDELIKYYEEKNDDFRLNDDSYNINIAEFSSFDKAVKFRSILMESDWSKSVFAFSGDKDFIYNANNILKSGCLLQPQVLFYAVSNLNPNEASLVLDYGNSKYVVVQLLQKLEKNSIPPFEFIKENVKEQYTILKNKEYIREYIDKLVEDNNVEIKRYKE